MPEHLFIDLDGPVLDGRERHYQCYSDILREHGHVPLPAATYWEMKRAGRNRRQQLAATGAGAIYEEFLASWLKRIEEQSSLALDRVQPGALERLRRWQAGALRLVIVTQRNNPRNLGWQLDALGLSPLFEQVLCVGSAGGGLEKARAVRAAYPAASPASALWIGDTEADVESARSLGFRVCAVACGLRSHGFLASLGPDQLVADLAAVQLEAP